MLNAQTQQFHEKYYWYYRYFLQPLSFQKGISFVVACTFSENGRFMCVVLESLVIYSTEGAAKPDADYSSKDALYTQLY